MGLFRKKTSETSGDSGYENILGRYYSFEDLQPIFCGNSGVILYPLGSAQLFDEHYPTIISTLWTSGTHIQQFFPTLDFSSHDKVSAFMLSAYKVTELGLKFTYVITVNHIPAGMFIITTPYLNNKTLKYNHWTMDFFLFEMFEGRGIMSVALPRMLLFLKNIGVDDIHFIVDVNNRRCLNLINKLPNDEIDNSQWHSSTNGLKPKVFSCPLSTISYKHR